MPTDNKKKEYGAGKAAKNPANIAAKKKRQEAAAYKKKTDAYLKEKKAGEYKGGSRRVSNAERPGLEKTTARKGDSPGVILTGKKKPKKKTAGIAKLPTAKIKATDISKGLKRAGQKEKAKVSKMKETQKAKEAVDSGVSNEKRNRLTKKADKLRSRIKSGETNSRKGRRLAARAKRKEERAAGKRKSGFGTALTKVGRATFGAAAALGGSDAALRKAGSKGSYYKRAAHEKRKKDAK